MSWFRKAVARTRDLLAVCMGLLILGLGTYYVVRSVQDPPVKPVTITAGRAGGQRHALAELLASEAKKNGQRVTVTETPGSDDALDRVNNREIDLALIQGGLDPGDRENLRQVATLHVEPLHLLVKAELYQAVARSVTALKGKVINLGESGSGTRMLALDVLRFAGLKPPGPATPGDFTPTMLSYPELQSETDRGKLPDAVFTVTSLPSPVARHLVATHDYRVAPLDFAEAFALDALARPRAEAAGHAHRVEKSHVYDTVIPAFTYGVEPPVPAEPIHTLGTRLLVVAHKDTDPQAVERLIGTMFNGPFAQVSNPPLSTKMLELPTEFPPHEGFTAYLERTKPLIAADAVDYLEKVLAITATLLGGVFFLGQGFSHWSARGRETRFKRYLLAVAKIEQEALALERAAELDLKQLLHLQTSLNELKDEALRKFAAGEFQGEQLIAGFLTLVNDTRNYLTRLILHQRENLEQQALAERRKMEDVWSEELDG